MITITDIATKAGVARSTVSYVLNERNTTVKISDQTRRRVMDVATELGYRRNELARAVTTGKNAVLGFWVMNAESEPDVRILAGAMKEADERKHFIKMLGLDSGGNPQQIAENCIDWRLSGIIVINSWREILESVQEQVAKFGIPIALVEGEKPSREGVYVTSQQEGGIAAAVQHLASLGHRNIAYLGGSPHRDQNGVFTDRRAGAYTRAMEELGLEAYNRVTYTHWDVETTKRAAREILSAPASERPTAVCCVCDQVAMALISTATKMGLRVPQDLSVTGFDDLSISAVYNPPLTTVHQPFEEMGREAVRRLLDGGSSTSTAKRADLSVRLVVRDSTAPFAG